ncbi:unnamed protein product [Parajaminaea phylloscopi]
MAPTSTGSANGNGVPTTLVNPAKLAAASSSSSSSASPSVSSNNVIDASAYLSASAKSRMPAPIRSLFPLEKTPGMISLLAGKPNADTYPIAGLSVQLKPVIQGEEPTTLNIQGTDLEEALQYGPTRGMPRLVTFLESIQERVHRRPIDHSVWQVTQGIGSQDLLTKAFECIFDKDDTFLVESPAFAGIYPSLHTLGVNLVPVATDDEGVCPKSLSQILDSWPADKKKPKGLYTTPIGANPSGTTSGPQRMRDVLAVCRKHKTLIFEDDPYYYLAFEGLGEDPVTRPRPRSYFSIEGMDDGPKGLVLRFDSFSKVLSGGMRMGYLTGHPVLVDAVDKSSANLNLQTSGVTQAIALTILEHWQLDGFLEHADRVSAFYKARRDKFEAAVHRILGGNGGEKASVAEWVTPKAGMFLWLKLKLPEDVDDSFDVISNEAKDAGVLAVPGRAFMPLGDPCVYVRTSFSLLPEADFDEACHRLRRVIEGLWSARGLQVPA